MDKELKVDIIGTYPPPIGGTSVHLKRLHESCLKNSIQSLVYDTHGKSKNKNFIEQGIIPILNYKHFYVKYLFNKRADIIHSHTHSWKERAMLIFKAKLCKQKVIFTLHSFREEKSNMSFVEKICSKYSLNKADYYIATSTAVEEKLLLWGVKKERISTVSPFILPDYNSISELDEKLLNFIDSFDFIICANASNNEHYLGNDIYGMDMCVDLQEKLVNKYNCGFVFVLTKETDSAYLEQIRKRITDKGIQKSFLIIQKPIDFLALIKKSKVFVRPTCTDSRPLSVDESIALGCPVVASNVCQHPNSCITFEARNQKEFYEKVCYVLENYDLSRKKVLEGKIEDESKCVFEIYEKVLIK